MMRIGVIGLQGAVSEHLAVVVRCFEEMGIEGEVFSVRSASDLSNSDGIIIPGGESSTISRHMKRLGIAGKIIELAKEDLPIMGTCAGCLILADEVDGHSETGDVEVLGLMEMTVERNAFGRQRESFEQMLAIDGFDEPYNAVFIRAPAITDVRGAVVPLASVAEGVVLARKENLLAVAFHPELTDDLRIHKMFIDSILK